MIVLEAGVLMPIEESIRANGCDEITLTPIGGGGRYLVVLGRNRFVACARIGLKAIPSRVVEMSPAEINEMRVKHTNWKPGIIEGRNYHPYIPGK